MKRVIEKGNLAFNHMISICDLCKRWKGDFTKNDRRICRYNTDDKGLQPGLVRNHMQNFKCKYYKRHVKYATCRLQSKSYRITSKVVTKHFVIKRGKLSIIKIEK